MIQYPLPMTTQEERLKAVILAATDRRVMTPSDEPIIQEWFNETELRLATLELISWGYIRFTIVEGKLALEATERRNDRHGLD